MLRMPKRFRPTDWDEMDYEDQALLADKLEAQLEDTAEYNRELGENDQ
jgi:hypothetical protein